MDETTTPETQKEVDYLDGFQYAGQILQFFGHSEGYVSATPGAVAIGSPPTTYAYNYVFNYTDHLGNVRLSYTKDPATSQLKVLEENQYYPFGLKHSVYNTGKMDFEKETEQGIPPVLNYVTKTKYDYKYNGKEFQDELGLNWYDYGFRNYDPALGRWFNVDLLSEKNIQSSPYSYVVNNPVLRIDPDGLTDYIYNRKTGEVKQVGEKNDEPDRILKSNRKGEVKEHKRGEKKGEAKVMMDGIAKGILHDGINLRDENNTIAVNGTNEDGTKQATTKEVENFIVDFANNVARKEISGYGLGYSADNITNILVEKFKENSSRHGKSLIYLKGSVAPSMDLNLRDGNYNSGFGVQHHYHTHLDMYGPRNDASEGDFQHKKDTGNLLHFIINSNGNGKHKY